MKKLLIILPVFFIAGIIHAQQIPVGVYAGQGKTYGNYKGSVNPINPQIQTANGLKIFTGTVIGECTKDCCEKKRTSCTVTIQNNDGIVTFGTRDYGFTVPKNIVGKTIIIESEEFSKLPNEKQAVRKGRQKDIQFAATGVKIMD